MSVSPSSRSGPAPAQLTSTNSRWTFWPTSVSVDAEWSSSSLEMSNFGCLRILTCGRVNNSRASAQFRGERQIKAR
jgi:hypothetical protein